MKSDLFQSCGHCWVFQICWHIECSTFTASSLRIWNSSSIPTNKASAGDGIPVELFQKIHSFWELGCGHLQRAIIQSTIESKMNFLRLYFVPGWQAQLWSHQKTDMAPINTIFLKQLNSEIVTGELNGLKVWFSEMGWDRSLLSVTGHKGDSRVTSVIGEESEVLVWFVHRCMCCASNRVSTCRHSMAICWWKKSTAEVVF